MLKKISKIFRALMIFILALIIFAIVFPMIHSTEKYDPADLKPEGNDITVSDGTTIHYRESGVGPALMLIHGFTSSSYTWTDVTPALAEKYHVLAPDIMGFGMSDKPEDGVYNYATFSSQLDEFLTKKKVRKVSIAGNSMGGGIAIRYALDHPEKVDKLILIASAGVDHGKRNIMFSLMATPGINTLMSSLNNTAFTKYSLANMCFHDKSLVTREKAEAYMLPFRTRGAMNAAARTMMDNDWTSLESELKNVKAPTLIIWGDDDKIIPPPYASKFNKYIPVSRLEMIEKCGHMPQEEKPELTAKLMLDFLKK